MLGCLLLLAAQAQPQGEFHEVVTLETAPDGARFERKIDLDGTLIVWVESDTVDPRLELQQLPDGRVLSDEDSGGGTTALLAAASNPAVDATWQVTVYAETPGSARVHVVQVVETESTRAAAQASIELVESARELMSKPGGGEGARSVLAGALAKLDVADCKNSSQIADAASQVGDLAWDLGSYDVCSEAWGILVGHRERTLPPTSEAPLFARQHLWVGELQKLDALWSAKSELQEQGLQIEHWAGWVLNGSPR